MSCQNLVWTAKNKKRDVGFTYGAHKTFNNSEIAKILLKIVTTVTVKMSLKEIISSHMTVRYKMIGFAKLNKVFIKNADTTNHSFKAVH